MDCTLALALPCAGPPAGSCSPADCRAIIWCAWAHAQPALVMQQLLGARASTPPRALRFHRWCPHPLLPQVLSLMWLRTTVNYQYR